MSTNTVPVTIAGNLTADPELRFTSSGDAVCNFNVAVTPRFKDSTTNEWKDGETAFYRCAIWRKEAENVAASLTKGSRVIVTGVLKPRSYTTQEGGEKRLSLEIDAHEVGASLAYHTAVLTKVPSQGNGGGAPAQPAAAPAVAPAAPAAAAPASMPDF